MPGASAARRLALLLLLNPWAGAPACDAARLGQAFSPPLLAGVDPGRAADTVCHVQTALEVLQQHGDLLRGRSAEGSAGWRGDLLRSHASAQWGWQTPMPQVLPGDPAVKAPNAQVFTAVATDSQAGVPSRIALQWQAELSSLWRASQPHRLSTVELGDLGALQEELRNLREKLERLQRVSYVRGRQRGGESAEEAVQSENRAAPAPGDAAINRTLRRAVGNATLPSFGMDVDERKPLSGEGVDSEGAKMEHRSGWLLFANIASISVAFAVIILLIVFCSPIRGVNLEQDKASGEMQFKDHSLSRNFVAVILPYWLPTDDPNAGWNFLAFFFMLAVSAFSLAFLWAASRVKVAVMSVPEVFTDTVSGQGFPAHFYLNWKMLILGLVGTSFFPLAYMSCHSKLRGRLPQWAILGLKLWLLFDSVFTNFLLSFTARTTQNWLVVKNADEYWRWNRTFTVFATMLSLMTAITSTWSTTSLALRWRTWMTAYVLEKYFSNRAYYLLNSNSGRVDALDNPDGRIELEIPLMIQSVTEFGFGLLQLMQTLVTTLLIVWMVVPYWVMYAVLYSLCGSFVAIWFMWQFTRLKYETDRTAADFRFSLVNVRSHAEAIALYSGEGVEKSRILRRFDRMTDYNYRNLHWQVGFTTWKEIFDGVLSIGPSIFLARLYMHGHLDFGGMGQAQRSFGSLGESLAYMQGSSTNISEVATSVTRLGMLLDGMRKLEGKPEIVSQVSSDSSVELRNVMVRTPGIGSRVLLSGISVRLGESLQSCRLLIVGRSGVGKSSLLRSIAGLWFSGGGEIRRPDPSQCIFLPQQPYMPGGSLRDQLCYPDVGAVRILKKEGAPLTKDGLEVAGDKKDSILRLLLADVQLGDLPDRFHDGFDHVDDWGRLLSLGEQQRAASVRCMLRTPKLVVLDEATSALSIADEQLVYRSFVSSGVTFVSVGHRATLLDFHDQVLELRGGDDWALYTIAEYRSKQAAEPPPAPPAPGEDEPSLQQQQPPRPSP